MKELNIKCLNSKEKKSGIINGQFLIESLNVGQGITVGTILRRTLLNNIKGTAITGIHIPNISHEFATIEGLREDILELILNLKNVVLKGLVENSCEGTLKFQGPGIITAKSLKLPSNIEIVNPNHYIGTISNSDLFEMKFEVNSGFGYSLISDELKKTELDFIKIDSVFMPVIKVDFKIESLVNSETENLILNISTNGSITPEEALMKSSKIIIDLFQNLIRTKVLKNSIPNLKEDILIEDLNLSIRSYNCLKKAQINSVKDLVKFSLRDLEDIPNFGKKSIEELNETLENKFGIVLNSIK